MVKINTEIEIEQMIEEVNNMTEEQLRGALKYVVFFSMNMRKYTPPIDHDTFERMIRKALEEGKE